MPRSPSPVIKLYTQSLNPYSEKVAGALALKGLAFERVVSDDPQDINLWSPIEHMLPVLEIDGHRKTDSQAIVSWLDELYPEPPLLSRDAKLAETQRHLATWSDSSFSWYWNRWRVARYPRPGDEGPVDAGLISRLMERLGLSLGRTPSSRADARELEIISELEDRLTDLVAFLRDRPFFHSDEPSIADLSVYAMLRVLQDGPIPRCQQAIKERPSLAAFIERMNDRIASFEHRNLDSDLDSGLQPGP
jgi:glutathione S-transferase